jgi:hypothetical protein
MSGSPTDFQKQQSLDKLVTLFNVKTSPIESTGYFKKAHVSHNDLCDAFAYWIDQVKMVFGEPVSVIQNQSLRDAGVDVLIDLQRSGIKFGIQVKSPGDVDNKGLSREVHAQITQSHRHNLHKLVLAFAGDYTTKEHPQRVGGLISELHQGDYGYLLIIPPEKVITIYKAYKDKENPMRHVSLVFETATRIISGIAESMSNENRTVSANIDIKYKIEDKSQYKYTSTLKFTTGKEGAKILDELENAHIVGDIVKIDNVEKVKVRDMAGNEVISETPHEGKLFAWSERQDALPLVTQIVDPEGKTVASMDPRMFKITKIGQEVHLKPTDASTPLTMELVLLEQENKMTFEIGIDANKGDAVQIFDAIEYVESLKAPNKLKVIDFKFDQTMTLDPPESFNIKADPARYNTARALSFIQKYTGKQFFMPDQLTKAELLEMMELATLIETGQASINRVILMMEKKEALRMLDAYEKNQIDDKSTTTITVFKKILGQDVTVKLLMKLAEMKPKEDIVDLRKRIEKGAAEKVDIELIRQ